MATLPRLVSAVLFAALLVYVAILLFVRQLESSAVLLGLAALVLIAFALPVLILLFVLRERGLAVEKHARVLRHLAVGDLREQTEVSLHPELRRAVELVRAELQRLTEANELQRMGTAEILNGIGEGVLAVDSDRRVRLTNRGAERLFGIDYRPDGKRLREVVRDAALNDAFDEAIEGRREWRARSTVALASELRQIEIRVFPLSNRGSDLAAVALLIDLTEVEKLQNFRRAFLADFHHEVRTPLAGIRLAAETLEAGNVEPEQTEHLNKVIQRQVRRLERLVDEVGQLNEIESGDVILQKEPTDLSQLLEDIASDFAEAAEAAGTSVVVTGEKAIADVDPTKVQQVVANLVDNALKHSRTRAPITLDVRNTSDEVIVSVSDQGEGIAREHQDRIFQRFYRVERSRSTLTEGTGLGLSIAKHLMLRHGGTIQLESSSGSGSTFSLHFPRPRS